MLAYLSPKSVGYEWPAGFARLVTTAGSLRLTRQIEFAGKSGARYRYTPLEEERALPPVGANYVIAKVTETSSDILFVGETENMSRAAWRERLAEAKRTYGQADVLTRLNVKSVIRQAEREDLIEEHHPPMNSGPSEPPPVQDEERL